MRSPSKTSYRENHAMKSTADSVIWGRDMDKSGENLSSHFRQTFDGYAGSVSSDRSPRSFRKGQQSTVDSVIWGRDVDKSGDGPHAHLRRSCASHAGNTGGDSSPRPLRQPGYAMKSSADTAIWGRDMDKSGENPHDHFSRSYRDYAGSPSGERSPRPSRKGDYSMRSTMDEVVFGRDLDLSGEDPHQKFAAQFTGHAGMRAVSPRDARRMGWLCVPGSEEHPDACRARSADSARSREASTRTPSPTPSGRGSAPKSSDHSRERESPQPQQRAPQRDGRLGVPGTADSRAGSRRASSRRPALGREASPRPHAIQACERPRWR